MSLVDVSEWQPRPIDFKALRKSGVASVYFRLADGNERDAETSKEEIKKARQADITVGGYYYSRVASPANNQRTGGEECNMCMNFAEDLGLSIKHPDLRLALDVEDLNGQPAGKAAEHFAQFVRHFQKHRGYYPVWYVSPGFMSQIRPHLEDNDIGLIKQCSLWEAHYTNANKPDPIKPWGDSWRLWQYTSTGHKPGIQGNIDINRVRDGEDTLKKLRVPK